MCEVNKHNFDKFYSDIERAIETAAFVGGISFSIYSISTLHYSLSDGGGWSEMKVSFSGSSQSILKRFSWNFVSPIF